MKSACFEVDLPTPLRAATQKARAAGLDVQKVRRKDRDWIYVETPSVRAVGRLLRFIAWRSLDPDHLASDPRALGLDVLVLEDERTTWRPYRLDPDRIRKLVERWHAPVIAWLHHDDAIACSEAIAQAPNWTKLNISVSVGAHEIARIDRVYGEPLYGDLMITGNDIFRHIGTVPDEDELILEAIHPCSFGSSLRRPRATGLDTTNCLEKFGPLTLAKLPLGHLSAHDRLTLTAYQDRINAIRNERPLAAADLAPLTLAGTRPALDHRRWPYAEPLR